MFWSAVWSVCFYFSLVVSQQCPDNSEYSDCGCMLTCESPYPTEECAENCQPGCFCSPGYVLRNGEQCVPQTQCNSAPQDMLPPPPRTQDTNFQYRCVQDEQYYDCTPGCKNTCENYNNPNAQCSCGPPGCFCKEGLVKRKDGKCVQPQECQAPPVECPAESVYIECGSECAPTCEEPKLRSCGGKCVSGCFCNPGYLLSKDGTQCIPPQYCNLKEIPKPPAPKCPEHSVFIRCGSSCAPTCDNLYPAPCEEDCLTGCFCYPGYLMDKNGTSCVRPDQCEITPNPSVTSRGNSLDDTTKCQKTEVYYECGTSCPKTCENPNPLQCTLQCVAGCFCKPGLLKRKDGNCVTQDQCDIKSQCGEDEQYYACPPSCKNTCRHYNDPGVRCRCGPPGCFCKEGLVKNEEGKCVRPDQCPVTPPKCVENAVFVPCGSSCPPTCDEPTPAPCSQRCVAGCFCKPGFLQTTDGKCVYRDQCKATNVTKCGEYAEYSECVPACPETCQNTQPRKPCIAACLPGCFCKPGYVRNKDMKCVATQMCDKKCSLPEEEYLECGSNCPDTCDNRSLPPSPTRCPYKCVRGCFCKKGLFRDLKGACVPSKDCPYTQTTPAYTETATTSTVPGVTVIDSRGCPDQKLCEAFCKSHTLRFGYCVGTYKTECRCA